MEYEKMAKKESYYIYPIDGTENLILLDYNENQIYFVERESKRFAVKHISIYDGESNLVLKYSFFQFFYQKIKIIINKVEGWNIERKNIFKYSFRLNTNDELAISTKLISIQPFQKIYYNRKYIGKIILKLKALDYHYIVKFHEEVENRHQVLLSVLVNMSFNNENND